MIRIALVDDDPRFLSLLHKKIESYIKKNVIHFKIIIRDFSNCNALLSSMEDNYYDIFFIDIEMPTMSGLQLAEIIRKRQPLSSIIFSTSYNQYAPAGYKVQALRYLSKPIDQNLLEEALSTSFEISQRNENGSLSVISYGNITRIPYREILYICHILRISQINTISMGNIKDHRGINDLFSLIHDERFVFIDRGTFVNIDHVLRIESSQLYLRNGETLLISRRMLPKVKLTINQILGGK